MRARVNVFVVLALLLCGTSPVQRGFADEPAVPKPVVGDSASNAPTLVFDSEAKQYKASPGEEVVPFTFNVTNVSGKDIIINMVKGSCGCTSVTMPADPWRLRPNESGPVDVQVRLAGKMGLITKTLTFFTSVGQKVVYLTVDIPLPPSLSANMTQAERETARVKAMADAQAIFKGDCAKCHADKGREALGQDLYAVDCGICHESSHRDSKVPDLHALKQPTDFDYWKAIITYGKPHSMMPAFAAAHGGPLTEEQIDSLATYLNHTISHHLSATNGVGAANGSNLNASTLP